MVADHGCNERVSSVAVNTVWTDEYMWLRHTPFSRAMRYVTIGTADGSEKYLVRV